MTNDPTHDHRWVLMQRHDSRAVRLMRFREDAQAWEVRGQDDLVPAETVAQLYNRLSVPPEWLTGNEDAEGEPPHE